MLIPYGTDAPLYRPPWGTLSLIVANIVLFLMQGVITPESWYVLDHGNGLHPIQWLLSAFAHAHPGHLIGNMIFLFSFGIVVESMMKLRYYFGLYFLMAIAQNFLEQVFMLGSSSTGSLGASSAIYGLMMVASLIAPGKNVKWLWVFIHWYFSRLVTFEVPVLLTGIFYFFWDFGIAMLVGFEMSTPLLHASGALVGVACGLLAYRLGWFELDGEDLISRGLDLIGKKKKVAEKDASSTKSRRIDGGHASARPPRRNKFGKLKPQLALLDDYIAKENLKLVEMKLAQIQHDYGERFELSEQRLVNLINLGCAKKSWRRVLEWMDNYLARFENLATPITLNKARIQTKAMNDPASARATLSRLQPSRLDQKQRELFYRIMKQTRKQLNEVEFQHGDIDPSPARAAGVHRS